jgi:chromosome segregation ATPase
MDSPFKTETIVTEIMNAKKSEFDEFKSALKGQLLTELLTTFTDQVSKVLDKTNAALATLNGKIEENTIQIKALTERILEGEEFVKEQKNYNKCKDSDIQEIKENCDCFEEALKEMNEHRTTANLLFKNIGDQLDSLKEKAQTIESKVLPLEAFRMTTETSVINTNARIGVCEYKIDELTPRVDGLFHGVCGVFENAFTQGYVGVSVDSNILRDQTSAIRKSFETHALLTKKRKINND